MTPKVSIITCTYNRPEMLSECLASMRAQTRGDFEHLVMNNGSTDSRVAEVMVEATRVEPRIRYYSCDKNINQPAIAWNDFVDQARGEYVGFLDDDNLKDPQHLEIMADVLDRHPQVDMVTCGFTILREDGGREENHLNLRTAEEIERRSTVDTGCFLIRRGALERIGYFPLDVRTNEDWALMRRAQKYLSMHHLSACLATWREHGAQRLRQCRDLGNERDKLTIRRAVWKDPYGVRAYHPPLDRLMKHQRDVVASIMAGIRAIPWVRQGADLTIALAPRWELLGQVEPVPVATPSTLLLHFEDPDGLDMNLDRVRGVASRCADTWALTNDLKSADAYRELLGERVIVCSAGDGGDPWRMARIINSVRSPRFGAVIP